MRQCKVNQCFFTDLGTLKLQENLDYYINLTKKDQKSFREVLEKLINIEKNNQIIAKNTCVKTANFLLSQQ